MRLQIPFALLLLTISILFSSKSWQGNLGFPHIEVIDKQNQVTSRITDGDSIHLRYTTGKSVPSEKVITFQLEPGGFQAGECLLAAGSETCDTQEFASLGWYWDAGGVAAPQRVIIAYEDEKPAAELVIQVMPRPVVLVHGFSSSWEAWANYLGEGGYLARSGLAGYAVGDGQIPGVLNTGNIADPAMPTNTIAQNAAILGEYISGVKTRSGAQMVDLVAHSMGGLISRSYIDQVMDSRDVSQLIMLGSPMAGTECANLPAALGFYLPAVLELRPSYVSRIFNQQVFHRQSVPFHALAGDPIIRPVQSPCTSVPSDLVVSQSSVGAIPLDLKIMPLLHNELNISAQVYDSYLLPLLQSPPGSFTAQPDSPPAPAPGETLQFTRVYTGHVSAGSSQDLTIFIDPGVSLANFALFDTTRSISVTVRGASGAVINLETEKNGLVTVDDPTALLYLGYGFENPRPGLWQITVEATPRTPAGGADFAVTALFKGGAILRAEANPLLPVPGDDVLLSASFDPPVAGLQIDQAGAIIHLPGGGTETLQLTADNQGVQGTWKPRTPGLHGIDLILTAHLSDGTPIERASYLSVVSQPPVQPSRIYLLLIALFCFFALLGSLILLFVIVVIRRRKR